MLVLNLPFKALMFLTLMKIGRAVQQECRDRKSGSAGMPRPISYAVFCLKKKKGGANRPLHLLEARVPVDVHGDVPGRGVLDASDVHRLRADVWTRRVEYHS